MVKTYHRPKSVDEALKLISNETDKNVPLAGGTVLALNPRGVDGLVDLADLKLSFVRRDADHLRIGAMTPIREIQRSEQVRQAAGGIIAESAKNYLTALIRNRATLGGLLAAGNFWADLVTVLSALNASVTIVRFANSSGKVQDSTVPLEDFIQKGPRKSLGGGIASEILVPLSNASARFAYNRVAKVETDISIVSAALAVNFSGRTVKSVRLVVGNGMKPVRLKSVDDQVAGRTVSDAAEAAARAAGEIPADSDIRASGEYRRSVAQVLVRRLFQSVA